VTGDGAPEFEIGLTLYVSGASDRSAMAIEATRRMCDVELSGRCLLTIVDVNVEPAALDRVGATPTLVREWPVPVRRVVGDVSDPRHVMRTLGLVQTPLSRSS
jgi:circadian clock protein KaiB